MEGLYCLSGLPLVMLNQGGLVASQWGNPYTLTFPVSFTEKSILVLGVWGGGSASHDSRSLTGAIIHSTTGADWIAAGF